MSSSTRGFFLRRVEFKWTIAFVLAGLGAGCQVGAVVPEGRGFVYACDAGRGADASCNETPGVDASTAEVQLPERFAAGSSFRIAFWPPRRGSGEAPLPVTSESGDVLGKDVASTGLFHVARPGSIALAAFAPEGEVLGRARLEAFAIDHLGLTRFSTDGVQAQDDRALRRVRLDQLGEKTLVRAVPMNAEGDVLGGALPCVWSSSNPSVVSIDGPSNGNFVRIDAIGAGTATLHVELGGAKADVEVAVARD